jgi:REP element-mobilizing transposase RayT
MTFWRSYAHLVWATKNREPLIGPEIEARLYAYLVSKAAELGCYVYAVNGVSDHVHLIVSIPPKHSVAWVVKNLKGGSSHFITHELKPGPGAFAWQRGYGYLSMGERQCEWAVAYVENQKQHHQTGTTNSWLEKTDDEEDEIDHNPVTGKGILRESQAEYLVFDDKPF